MTSNYTTDDPILGQIDLDDYFITDSWLVDQFVGNGLWSWGYNNAGQLGLGNLTHRSSPVQVGSLTNWKEVSATYQFGGRASAIKTDGTLWTWGVNTNGQLGLNDLTGRSSPVQVGTLTNWKQTVTGPQMHLALTTNNALWSWGQNTLGQLGLGNLTHRSSPTQVGSLTNWKFISGGSYVSAGTKTDGTLWMWGTNGYGNLGLNDRVHRSSPVQVGSLTNWKFVSCAMGYGCCAAIKTDGTLWTWGANSRFAGPIGQLGLNDIVPRSSPTQVGSLTNWKQVSCGSSMLAIKTDGTLWSWGNNTNGSLGLGDLTHRSSPVQVGSLTNWKQVFSDSAVLAIKTDGTLWTWGNNLDGRLGLGDTAHRSSPVQVGTLTNWKQVHNGFAIAYSNV